MDGIPNKWDFFKYNLHKLSNCETTLKFCDTNEKQYLLKRNEIYYFCKRFNKKIVRISLRTKSLITAKKKRNKILKDINTHKTYTKKEFEELFNKNDIKDIDNSYNEDIELSNEEQELYLKEIFNEEVEQFNKIKELEQKKENQILDIVKQLNQKMDNTPVNNKVDNVVSFTKEEIIKYYEEFLSEKIENDKLSESSIKQYNTTLKYFLYFLKEKNNDLSFKFFKDLQTKFKKLPHNLTNTKRYDLSFSELMKVKETDNYEILNNKTINAHILRIGVFVSYLVYNEFIEINHCNKLKELPEEKETNKEEYSEEDLKNIFNSEVLTEEDKEFCKISLFTGMRLEELCKLKKKNIDINEKLINIDMIDNRSKKHTRTIPIHSEIFKLIEDRLKLLKNEDCLYFNDKSLNATGKYINRKLNKIITKKGKTFHSFRKNFSQMIEETKSDYKVKKYLMGHSLDSDITHKIYNRGKINIELLRDCINDIKLENIDY